MRCETWDIWDIYLYMYTSREKIPLFFTFSSFLFLFLFSARSYQPRCKTKRIINSLLPSLPSLPSTFPLPPTLLSSTYPSIHLSILPYSHSHSCTMNIPASLPPVYIHILNHPSYSYSYCESLKEWEVVDRAGEWNRKKEKEEKKGKILERGKVDR